MTVFSIGYGSVRSYRRLSYTPWHALAEFVDNSTQAYFDNEETLDAVYTNENSKLRVDIKYNSQDQTIVIFDNSFGMDLTTLDRAMTVGEPPPDPSGRSQYGMGLKTAACWLGDHWTVRTSQLGVATEYLITVDVEKVADGETELPVKDRPVDAGEHYTEITISDLNVTFRGRRPGKVKDYLSSMYQRDLRSKRLELSWQGEDLQWQTARGNFLTDATGDDYYKELEIEVPFDADPESDEEEFATVTGWVGILERGSRSEAGFSMFHNDRMIKGYPSSWRPEEIFGPEGGSNNLVNQRIVGEFQLDDFPVTHTKDGLVWSEQEEERVERAIRAEIADYLVIAESTRTRQRAGPQPSSVRKARRSIGDDVQGRPPGRPLSDETVDRRAAESEETAGRYASGDADLEAELLGKRVRAFLTDEETRDGLFASFLLGQGEDGTEAVVVANLRHPFLDEVVSAESLNTYLRLILIDAASLSEIGDARRSERWIALRDALMRALAQGSSSRR